MTHVAVEESVVIEEPKVSLTLVENVARVSVFTPSHDTTYLLDCYESMKAQTFTDWEWIILLNQSALPERFGRFAQELHADKRVKIRYTQVQPIIGALKAEAVSHCTGEILVELDHDDLLLPEALELIIEAFDKLPNVGFVYSDFAQINADGTPNVDEFNPAFGWTYYKENDYNVCVSMTNHPHNNAYIWSAPNHVRAFRRSVYDEVGGYATGLDILDDQDLMCRMYLATDFFNLEINLYLQRVGSFNTQKRADKNARIQTETIGIYDQYIQPMILKWAKQRNLRCLDLGGAHNPANGYETVDLHDADLVGDIFDVLGNLDDNSVGVIRAVDFFEHITDKVKLWNEMYRVLADGGMILSLTPSSDGRGADMDPTHVAYYNECSFWYFAYESHKQYVPELQMNFHVSRLVTFFPNEWHERWNIPYVCANLVANKTGLKLWGLKVLQ